MPGRLVSEPNSGSSREGRMVQDRGGSVSGPVRAKHRARPHDAFAINDEERIGEGETSADPLYVDMRLDPVADLGGAGEVGGQVRRDEAFGWVLPEGGAIAECDIGERHQQTAVRDTARIGMLLGDAQADDQALIRVASIEQRPDRFEERTGAEQRRETGRGIRGTHEVILRLRRHYRIKRRARPADIAAFHGYITLARHVRAFRVVER
jgi:hypothetical protein